MPKSSWKDDHLSAPNLSLINCYNAVPHLHNPPIIMSTYSKSTLVWDRCGRCTVPLLISSSPPPHHLFHCHNCLSVVSAVLNVCPPPPILLAILTPPNSPRRFIKAGPLKLAMLTASVICLSKLSLWTPVTLIVYLTSRPSWQWLEGNFSTDLFSSSASLVKLSRCSPTLVNVFLPVSPKYSATPLPHSLHTKEYVTPSLQQLPPPPD